MEHPRKLFVEGAADKRVIPYLMEANGVEWDIGDQHVVHIEAHDGIDNLLQPGVIGAELRASELEALGVLVDANGDAQQRWSQLKRRIRDQFADLPDEIPENGLNVIHSDGARFGVWIMPDNRYSGMLENFLVQLVPEDSRHLFEVAENCVAEAKQHGAPFKDVHRTKAAVHTWLAWQDEPGKQLHEAVDHGVLDPERPESQPFVNWFRQLFEV